MMDRLDQPELWNYTIDTTGTFRDDFGYTFYNSFYNPPGSWDLRISGSHTGMSNNELFLTFLHTVSGAPPETYRLEENFDLTFNNVMGSQDFAITGFGLNATDPSIVSSYNISFDEATAPNPVPAPAAAWLFASGLLGFVSFNIKRLTKSNIS